VGVKDPAEETFCHPNRNVIKNDIPVPTKVNRTPSGTQVFARFCGLIMRFMQFLAITTVAKRGLIAPYAPTREKSLKNEEFSCQETAAAFRMFVPVPCAQVS
jgi:hypothetical protein